MAKKVKPAAAIAEQPKAEATVARGLAAIAPELRHRFVDVTYTPGDKNEATVVIGGVPFRAHEPVAIPADRHELLGLLRAIPWFCISKAS